MIVYIVTDIGCNDFSTIVGVYDSVDKAATARDQAEQGHERAILLEEVK